MARKQHKQEEILAELGQVEVLWEQDETTAK
jgi:hypothetical protein